ncbi:MAG: NmrA family NAD(P)-binding protein [Gammaproteobacteria bacterium]
MTLGEYGKMKVLVIGGTGSVGSEVVAGIRRSGAAVRCMSRYPKKLESLPQGVEGCVGDLEKPATLNAAFAGVHAVFLTTALSRNETLQGLAAVSAAKRARVAKLVSLSVPMPPGSAHIPHYRSKIPIERAIQESDLNYTILRPNNFFQNDYLWCRAAVMCYGVYPQPIGSVGLNRVDIRDVAEAAVHALLRPGHDGKDYPLHGADVLTGESVAAIFSRHLGREIHYGGNDLEAWAKQAQHMMPEWMVKDLRIMYDYFQSHGLLAAPQDFTEQYKLLGRDPRRFDDFVAEIVPIWKREMASDPTVH